MRSAAIGFFCGLGSLLASSTANSQPSFDCRRATKPDERAVCASPSLARLDRQLATEYRAARSRFSGDRVALTQLAELQQWFLASRGNVYDYRVDALTTIDGIYRDRIAELKSLTPRQTRWVGEWSGLRSKVTVISGRGGALSVSLLAVEPTTARWICDYEAMHARIRGNDLIVAYTGYNGEPLPIVLSRVGSLLEVRFSEGTLHNCGNSGSVAGRYLPSKPSTK